MPVYNKLVRDKIPEIIEANGAAPNVRILEEDEYIKYLKEKCSEELNEYFDAETNSEEVEELPDLLEIMHALAAQHGSSIEEVEHVRRIKAEKRGRFQEKIFLMEVVERE